RPQYGRPDGASEHITGERAEFKVINLRVATREERAPPTLLGPGGPQVLPNTTGRAPAPQGCLPAGPRPSQLRAQTRMCSLHRLLSVQERTARRTAIGTSSSGVAGNHSECGAAASAEQAPGQGGYMPRPPVGSRQGYSDCGRTSLCSG